MATTTPNFGWAVPTSTDLVKDGAVAIETLGDSIDASLVDLKGGTTGQVLAKASNTDMDFTWTAVSGGSSNVAGKNGVLNSNFSVWQRGTSIAQTAPALYTADRWQGYQGTATAITYTRQTTSDTTNLPFIQYCARIQRNSGSTATSQAQFAQSIESVNSIPYAGKSTTISFYARRGANYSMASNEVTFGFITGTGTDQNVLTGFTGAVANYTNYALTTTWQRFTYTQTIATNATQIGFAFFFTPTGTAGANDYFEVTGVQLEAASSASAYSPNTSTQQAELAACQRYYQRKVGSSAYQPYSLGFNYSTTQTTQIMALPVTMRTSPTMGFSAANTFVIQHTSNLTAPTSITGDRFAPDVVQFYANVASGLTAGQAAGFNVQTGQTGFIEMIAEL
jgi:hypothetical protein